MVGFKELILILDKTTSEKTVMNPEKIERSSSVSNFLPIHGESSQLAKAGGAESKSWEASGPLRKSFMAGWFLLISFLLDAVSDDADNLNGAKILRRITRPNHVN